MCNFYFTGKDETAMRRKKSIEQKVVALVLGVSFIALFMTGAATGFGMYKIVREIKYVNASMGNQAADESRMALEELTIEELSLVAENKAQYLETLFDKYESHLNILSGYVGSIYNLPDIYKEQQFVMMSLSDSVSPIAHVAYAPGVDAEALESETALLANVGGYLSGVSTSDSIITDAYVGTESGILFLSSSKQRLKIQDDYDHRTRNWYTIAKNSGEFSISEAYDDAYGRGKIISFSMPIYNESGEFLGVAGLNVLAEGFKGLLKADEATDCEFVIISQDENVVVSNDYREEKKNDIIDEFVSDNESNAQIKDNIFNKQYGTDVIEYRGRQIYVSHQKLSEQGWIVLAYVAMDEAVAPSLMIKENIINLADNSVISVTQYVLLVVILVMFVLIVVLVITYIFGNIISKKITRPIVTLTDNVKEISHGNLKFNYDIKTDDEIQDLADAFRNMTTELDEHMSKMQDELKEKERRRAELEIAKKIQMSILPKDFASFTNAMEFEISATIRAAKGVAGDFYDFFMVDKDHLAIVIADVSGKGVPAALFMMITKSLIDNRTKQCMTAGEILTEVNKELCASNEAGMFVTAFLGILNIRTGEFQYSNAGHMPPLIYRYKRGFEWLYVTTNLFLAGMDDTEYKTDRAVLGSGDMILLYTDGVTEAVNTDKKQFGKDGLYNLIGKFAAEHMTLDEIIALIMEDIDEFAMGVEQKDDITMLITRFFSQK